MESTVKELVQLVEEGLSNGMTYEEYFSLAETLVEENSTTGPNKSDELAKHTKMGFQRMKKWEKISKISEETSLSLSKIRGAYAWLIIVESWCGDVGQNIVALKRMADLAGIEIRLVLRDENLELMDQFLTNGGRAIPKLIVFDKNNKRIAGEWGPRPAFIQNWFYEEKSKEDFNKVEALEYIHLWYAKNKQQEIQQEIVSLMSAAEQE